MLQAVFLDRDGVINSAIVREGKPYPPSDISQLQILPRVKLALTALKKCGFHLVIVTNQPDVARGTMDKKKVEEINSFLMRELPIDDIYVCYHDDQDSCSCRKPMPGLIYAAANKYGIDLRKSYMIGDRWRDIDAGRNAECQTIFIDKNYNEKKSPYSDYEVSCLFEAAAIILARKNYVMPLMDKQGCYLFC